MNEVLQAAFVAKLKAAAAAVLALALAGAVVAGVVVAQFAGKPARPKDSEPNPAVSSQPSIARSADHRPADEIVEEIEALLKTARRPLVQDLFDHTHGQIAALVDELRTAYPHDPRLGHLLPERWTSLDYVQKKDLARAETDAVLMTTRDPVLRKNAFFFASVLKMQEPTDCLTAVSLAEEFARQAPGDNRAGELFFWSTKKLTGAWLIRVAMFVTLTLAGR